MTPSICDSVLLLLNDSNNKVYETRRLRRRGTLDATKVRRGTHPSHPASRVMLSKPGSVYRRCAYERRRVLRAFLIIHRTILTFIIFVREATTRSGKQSPAVLDASHQEWKDCATKNGRSWVTTTLKRGCCGMEI